VNLVGVGREKEPVHEYNYTTSERRVNLPPNQLGSRRQEEEDLGLVLHAVGGIENERPDGIAEWRTPRFTKRKHFHAGGLQPLGDEAVLGGLAGAFRSLENNELSRSHAGFDQESVMIELVAPFFIPSMIQLFTWYMTLSKFSCAEIAR